MRRVSYCQTVVANDQRATLCTISAPSIGMPWLITVISRGRLHRVEAPTLRLAIAMLRAARDIDLFS